MIVPEVYYKNVIWPIQKGNEFDIESVLYRIPLWSISAAALKTKTA